MHKQLILLHNAIAAYFSGNAKALDATLKQFNIKVLKINILPLKLLPLLYFRSKLIDYETFFS